MFKRSITGIAAGVLLACAIAAAHAQTVELLPVETVTLTTQQFLTGDENGKPAVLAGELRIPKPGTDLLPAVVLLLGAGGITPMIERWSQDFNDIGIASFMLDSFSGRGIGPSKLDNVAMMIDGYRALDILAAHPRIDPARIAVMGISKGAMAALYSSNQRFVDMYSLQHRVFAAHIVLFAPCNITYRDDVKITGKPIRMFHGIADDLFSIEPCRAYAGRLKERGADVELTEFPDAYHAFHAFVLKAPQIFPQAMTTRNCHMIEGDNGQIMNVVTGKPFDYADSCVERGFTFAYNEAAALATHAAVRAFLTATLK